MRRQIHMLDIAPTKSFQKPYSITTHDYGKSSDYQWVQGSPATRFTFHKTAACCSTRIVAARVKCDKAPPSGLETQPIFWIAWRHSRCEQGLQAYIILSFPSLTGSVFKSYGNHQSSLARMVIFPGLSPSQWICFNAVNTKMPGRNIDHEYVDRFYEFPQSWCFVFILTSTPCQFLKIPWSKPSQDSQAMEELMTWATWVVKSWHNWRGKTVDYVSKLREKS